MKSNIARIVDASAAVAARVQNVVLPNGSLAGVRSVFGAGQGLADPLRPGQTIQPAPETAEEPYSHISDLPDAPAVNDYTQDLLVELDWMVPMRLYVARGDLRTVRATLLPFYDAYLAAFWADYRLGGLCNSARIRSLRPAGDGDWVVLEMELAVIEEVSYG